MEQCPTKSLMIEALEEEERWTKERINQLQQEISELLIKLNDIHGKRKKLNTGGD